MGLFWLFIGMTIGMGIGGSVKIVLPKRKRQQDESKPICMCGDHYGTHDPQTGACNAKKIEDFYSSEDGKYQKTLGCDCLRYVGPVPIETYWVPPAADMNLITAPRPLPEKPTPTSGPVPPGQVGDLR